MGADLWEVIEALEADNRRRGKVEARLQKVRYHSNSLYYGWYIYYQNPGDHQEMISLVNI